MLEFSKKYAILKNNTARQAYVLFWISSIETGFMPKTMKLKFDIDKALACVGFICAENNNPIDLYRLMKLVYLADRKSFVETFRPITNDNWVNMPHGPVNSTVYDLTKGTAPAELQEKWDSHFSCKNHLFSMKCQPRQDVLTGLEIEAIKSAIDALRDCRDFFSIRDKMHKLPEYVGTQSSEPVNLKKILEAEYVGITDEEINDIINDLQVSRG